MEVGMVVAAVEVHLQMVLGLELESEDPEDLQEV
jgi:hypothetical protein